MTKNYKILLQYEGTKYQGWQKQDSTENTLQGKLEAILTKMTGEKVEVQGSGRTDAGVHALGQVANFHIDTNRTAGQIQEYLNQYLPEDVGVIAISKVDDRFHSRLNAKGKVYKYRVINSTTPHVFDRRYAYTFTEKLNIEKMQEAAKYLIGTHDFKGFTSKKIKKATVRTLEEITIEKKADEVIFTFVGDGFLYHMVRILMGTLLEVGTETREARSLESILKKGNREAAGPLVPALGLTLVEVKY